MPFPPPSTPPATAPAGWYQDPYQTDHLRYFDGRVWTSQVWVDAPMRTCPVTPPMSSLLWSVLGGVVALFVSTVAAIVALLATVEDWSTIDESSIMDVLFDPWVVGASVAGLWVGFATAFVATARTRRLSWRAAAGGTPLWATAGSFAAGILLQLALAAVAWMVGANDTGWSTADLPTSTLVVVAFAAIVGAPLFEELYFRGVLLPTLATGVGAPAAIGIQAALFGVLHAEQGLVGVIVITAVGVLLGWLRTATKSVVPPIALHLGFNATAIALLVIP